MDAHTFGTGMAVCTGSKATEKVKACQSRLAALKSKCAVTLSKVKCFVYQPVHGFITHASGTAFGTVFCFVYVKTVLAPHIAAAGSRFNQQTERRHAILLSRRDTARYFPCHYFTLFSAARQSSFSALCKLHAYESVESHSTRAEEGGVVHYSKIQWFNTRSIDNFDSSDGVHWYLKMSRKSVSASAWYDGEVLVGSGVINR